MENPAPPRGTPWVLILTVLLLLLFVLSFPGLGIETRPYSSYATWAGPLFLVLTIILFATGIASIVLRTRRKSASLNLAMVAGVAAIVIVALDTSHVGGLPPPAAPLLLGVVSAIVGALLIVAAAISRVPAAPALPASAGP